MPNMMVANAWIPRIARRSLRNPQDEPATTPARPKISASMALNSTDEGVGEDSAVYTLTNDPHPVRSPPGSHAQTVASSPQLSHLYHTPDIGLAGVSTAMWIAIEGSGPTQRLPGCGNDAV